MTNLQVYLRFLLLFIIFVSNYSLSAVSTGQAGISRKYTTLQDGAWDDTQSVWSLDNETPCKCSPGRITEGNEITINHATALSYNLQITKGSTITILEKGFLSGNYEIDNRHGILNNYGVIEIAKYVQGSKSVVNILPNGFMEINQSISIGKGEFNVDQAKFVQTSGNFDIDKSGKLIARNNAVMNIEFGDIVSRGKITLMNSSTLFIGDRAFRVTKDKNSDASGNCVIRHKLLGDSKRKAVKKL